MSDAPDLARDSSREPSRELDLVLFGATGFTGGLTADYLAAHAPADLRWAIAGRNADKLDAVRRRLGADVEVLVADSTDAAALADIARRARVVATTIGPYLDHGGPLVAACAEAGTDYLDLTGEPEFVDRMFLEHHRTALRTGARLVHACGFDSVPHDLGAYYTVQQLPSDEPITLRGVVRSGGTFSGGTFHSALNQFARAKEMRKTYAARRRAEVRPEGRSSRSVGGKPHRDPVLGYWLLPLPTIDPIVVARSGAALEAYGPRFRYSHWAGTKTLRYAAAGALGVGALTVAAQVGPLRELLKDKVPVGSGPDESKRERSWFTVDFVGEAAGTTVHTRVSGGDPGYTETAKMLSEAALCLALDDNPATAGQVTPAEAMGDALVARLQAAGMRFETL
ncbi:saccharopine dehydrogenase NADP-binding domain-containing protein [Nocardioides sp. S-58]|uniref:Saccharopine dehydrogenase NADP-binding domain-containing protein n=1 Tax=Nocardioides renjunii TaxID=3095075 RepID=A0ABU5K702_9ACTN|nr:saccharopine dehydrogenase NADP-binding domain-containing protein [Nocardioides sp. S-58]MDZ5660750.1 saccharopine dehydrogenase NADP-binding domain-containing protein [Nocardioides sp. S-58]